MGKKCVLVALTLRLSPNVKLHPAFSYIQVAEQGVAVLVKEVYSPVAPP